MKILIANLLLLFPGVMTAGETLQTAPVIQVRVEYIELSHEACTRLMFSQPAGGDDATAMRATLQEMVAANQAKVLETMLLACRSGSKATVESIRELIYPTEYSAPALPCSPSMPLEGPETIFPQMPTAFDTRNCGSSMEIAPSLSEDGRSVQLDVVPEVVTHGGNKVVQEGKAPLGNPVTTLMPDFHAARANVRLNCPNSRQVLAGVLSPAGTDGKTDMTRKILVMVRCDVLKPD